MRFDIRPLISNDVTTFRELRLRATIWGMFVAPEARGAGLGRALLERALSEARTWPNVTRVVRSAEGA